ncbi:MAG: hypothetical protein IPJ36_07820 [Simplicispira sp.]|nr:hypothetical protein [Simplicispira sp.]
MSADAATADFSAPAWTMIDLRQPLVVLVPAWQQIEASLAHLFSRKTLSGHARSGLVWRGSCLLLASPTGARASPHHDRCSTSSTPLT